MLLQPNDSMRTLYIRQQGRVRHEFLMGKSGQGKTEYLFSRIAQQIARGGGTMFVDPKPTASSANIVYSFAKAYNREQDFRLLDISNPAMSHTANILLEGSSDEATSTVGAIFGSGPSDNESSEHFRQQMLTAVSNRIGCIKKMGKAFNAMDLFILLTNPNAMAWLISNTPQSDERMALTIENDSYYVKKGDKVEFNMQRLQAQVGGGANRLFTYGTGRLGEIFSTYSPQFTIDDAIDNNRIVYVPLPKLDMPEQSTSFAKMLLSAVKIKTARIYRSSLPPIPFQTIWDEFGSIAIKGTEELVEKKRGANISGIYSFQTYANLTELGEAFAARLVGNCEMRTFMALGDTDSRVFASDLIGELLKEFGSRSKATGVSTGNTHLDIELFHRTGKTNNQGTGISETYDYAVRPESLRDLPIGQAFCVPMAAARALHVQFPMCTPPKMYEAELPVVRNSAVVGLNLQSMFNEHFSQT
jgi:intracellular multiplication protein IcmO